MADTEETTLSIVLRAVDKSTAAFDSLHKKIDDLSKGLGELGKVGKQGSAGIFDGYERVGEKIKGVGSAVKELFGRLLATAGAGGVAALAVFHMVDEFDALGDKSDRLGVTVDFLASMRFAAERSGAEVEELDTGLQTFLANVGAAKANKGNLFKFLSVTSPDLLKQIKLAKSGEQAFRIFADGVAALTDQEKKLALAEKAGFGAALVPLLSRGSSGLLELQGEFAGTAGSLEEAAARAGEVDDSLKNLKAASEGVKGALVTGLSPALKEIVDQLKDWLVGHRQEIATWAADIGHKLPGAIESLVTWVGTAYDKVMAFMDGIGGWKTAALALGVALEGPLIASLAALSVAMVATPFGQVLLGISAVTFAIMKLTGATESFESVAEMLGFEPKKKQKTEEQQFKEDQEAMMEDGRRAARSEAAAKAAIDANPSTQQFRALVDQDSASSFFDADKLASVRAKNDQFAKDRLSHVSRMADLNAQIEQFQAQHPGPQQAQIKIDIAGLPPGARVTQDPRNTAAVDLTTGYQTGGGAW